ncbi:ShlB/FhaC/HecB family hemolysin secretion/activation protein [Pseudoteredinibacter isoporae]|uniref:Hemolysin activation/secretion protein n=1 Tax=Pseudoteredinibacter isoporae TaxID=570281 RepID=A0A7X0JTP7_9GAMM|nr:ShlB/FhaC/HecB family hemolysin secretion/activation protein [Pseudoteredinibacter isoporae]MBB6521543.1 hemolysin activation/secretion protein [Pseudoteredinibacter isoporae]NHO87097.1 ShlB/FhaC/HecB family hemolysin secretion/activation protein [Pseudoteredinibacter isoporae]NIB22921.1 ShlB/FhaC/HecB family hemolysin secretion/activation protein [Pseudoteredinibacter isoporae]
MNSLTKMCSVFSRLSLWSVSTVACFLLPVHSALAKNIDVQLFGEHYTLLLPEYMDDEDSRKELFSKADAQGNNLLVQFDEAWWQTQAMQLQKALNDQEQSFLSGPRYAPEALTPLARYLRLLMPELDIGAPISIEDVSLNEIQYGALFNLLYELRENQDNASPEAYLTSINFQPRELIKRNLSRLSGRNFTCLYQIDDELQISLRANWVNCLDEARPQLLWVNQVNINYDEASTGFDVEKSNISNFVSQQSEGKTQYQNDGREGFDPFDLALVAIELNRAFVSSSAGQRYTAEDNQLIAASLEQLRQQHAMSFSDLRDISESLQDFIRAQGYLLAKVYIPQQDFRAADGVVELAVASGILSEIHFRNIEETDYKEDVLIPAFQNYLMQPVSSDLSSAYFRINDIPGLSVQAGFFEPGEENGQTRLNLGLEEEDWQLQVRSDNYGSEATGEYRVLAGLDWYNLTGHGDSINIGLLQASSPSNTSYGFAKYRYPFWGLKADVSVSYEQTQYEAIGGQGANTALSQGDLSTASLAFDYRWLRSKDLNLSISLAAIKKTSDTTVTLQLGDKSVVDGLETEVKGAQFDIRFDYLMSSLRALTDWRLSYFSGNQTDINQGVTEKDYDKISLNSDTLFLLPVNLFGQPLRLNAKFQAIHSSELLPTFERQPLGGPYAVKAFKTADFTGDKTVYGNLQLLSNVSSLFGSLGEDHDLSVALFAEASYGELNALNNQTDSWARFQAYGAALFYSWREDLRIELSMSFSGSKDSSADFADIISEPEESIYISMSYRY